MVLSPTAAFKRVSPTGAGAVQRKRCSMLLAVQFLRFRRQSSQGCACLVAVCVHTCVDHDNNAIDTCLHDSADSACASTCVNQVQ